MSADNKFAERLTAIRGSRKKTEMAKFLGIDRVTYGNYEIGNRRPSIELIASFCEKLDVTADYLLGLSDTKRPEYKNIAKETGLNEAAIHYLKLIKDSSLSSSAEIINFLLEEEPDISHLESPQYRPPKPRKYYDSPNKNIHYCETPNYDKSIFDYIKEDWGRADYYRNLETSGMDESIIDDEDDINWNSFPEPTEEECKQAYKEIHEMEKYLKKENSKSKLLTSIRDYLYYENSCSLSINEKTEILTSDHNVHVQVGNKTLTFPSKESDELFEFMLIQNVIDALRIFKKNYKRLK